MLTSGTTFTLFKSSDAGRSWTTTGKVSDAITDIAISPQDSSNIYYATASRVYKSTDSASTFTPLRQIRAAPAAGLLPLLQLMWLQTPVMPILSLSAQLILMPRNTVGSIFWTKVKTAARGPTPISEIMMSVGLYSLPIIITTPDYRHRFR